MSRGGDLAMYTYALCVTLFAIAFASSSAICAAQSSVSLVSVTNLDFSLGFPPKHILAKCPFLLHLLQIVDLGSLQSLEACVKSPQRKHCCFFFGDPALKLPRFGFAWLFDA